MHTAHESKLQRPASPSGGRWLQRCISCRKSFPIEERYGLRSQVRRAATSVATKIVEGSVRPSERYWVNYLETVLGSACETRYLLEISIRVELLRAAKVEVICHRYSELIAGLQALITSMPAGRSRG